MDIDNKELKDHQLTLKNREFLEITGIKKIECLNPTEFVLETILGTVIITGRDLEMASLNISSGELNIKGYVNSVNYQEKKEVKEKKENVFTKLFK